MTKKQDSAPKAKPETLRVDDIAVAQWNTHGDPKKDPDFDGLVASMRENGLVQRITVRHDLLAELDDETHYELIDGHRRLAAAKALGWKEIAADVVNADDETAQLMTATANLQRTENDPILEADLIKKLRDAGLTVKDIAAKLGKDEGYIYRRSRLVNLTESWRKAAYAEGSEATVAQLEDIAQFEPATQNEVFAEVAASEGSVHFDSFYVVKRAFNNKMHRLAGAPFDTGDCAACPYNTGCKRMLFEEMDEIGDDARCEKDGCFAEKWNAAVDAKIEKLRKKGLKVGFKERKYDIPDSWSLTERRTKDHTEPWSYMEGSLKMLAWGRPSAAKEDAKDALTEEEREAIRRVKKAHKAWKQNRTAAYDKVRKALGDVDTRRRYFRAVIPTEEFRDWAERYLERAAGFSDYIFDGFCQEMRRMTNAATLAEWNVELTDEELSAVTSEDPANAKEVE